MRRREFLALLGCAATWPLGAGAERASRPFIIGTLHPYSPPDPWLAGLRQGLRDLGYVEGKNITIEERWAEGSDERLDRLAKELIDGKTDILVVMMGPALRAATRHTTTVPIVMAVSGDGRRAPGVASLARPGGNVTGLTLMSPDLAGLRLSMLREAVPAARRVAVLYNSSEGITQTEMLATEVAARSLGVTLQPVEVHSADALGSAFADASAGGADALITFAHAFAFFHRQQISELAARYRLPAMYGWREYPDAGGLMAYGPNVASTLSRSATFIDRIIKGGNPGDMPIEQPTKFELVVNLKAAKALGLTVPESFLLRADEVIE